MLIRIAFGLALVAAAVMSGTRIVESRLARDSSVQVVLLLFVATRLLGWLTAYVVLGSVTQYSDLVLYYHPEASRAIAGEIPYRDFATSYGFLFPYVSGALLSIWNAHAATALVIVAFEIAAILIFARGVRGQAHDSAVARALLFYTLNPAALYWSGMLAYNSTIVLFCWVIALVMVHSGRYGVSLLALAASVVAGKVLGVVPALTWLAHPDRRRGPLAAMAAAATVLGTLGLFVDINLLLPLLREGDRSTSGNLWFLVSGFISLSSGGWVWRAAPPVLFAATAAVTAIWLRGRWVVAPSFVQLSAAISAFGWLFMLLSKKSYPHYTPMFLLFTTIAVGLRHSRRSQLGLVCVGAVGVVEPGLWNALRQPQLLSLADWSMTAAALVAADLVLVTAAAYFCVYSIKIAGYGSAVEGIRRPHPEPAPRR